MVMSSAYGTSPYDNSASVGIDAGTVTVSSVPIKKKRGRPKKCAPDGTMPPPPPLPAATHSGGAFSPSSPSFKKVRGRPPGSSKKHQTEALGSVGLGFTPHIITVKAGEDVSSKIMAFSQNGSRAVCILSANGAISDVILRQAAISGGCVTYEGRFEILSLSGSYLLSENGSQRSRTGGLSVSLAGPDGCVLGGSVAGLLTAASPVQVIVGSFISGGGHKEMKAANQVEPVSGNGTPNFVLPGGGALGGSSPPSHGTLSESSGGPGSPFNQSPELYDNGSRQQGLSGTPWK